LTHPISRRMTVTRKRKEVSVSDLEPDKTLVEDCGVDAAS